MKNPSSSHTGKCSFCEEQCSQIVCFSSGSLEHRRCSGCGKISVFAFVTVKSAGGERGKKEWKAIDYPEIIKRRPIDPPDLYLPQSDYSDGDYISHPQFGDGYVLAVLSPRRMRVLFAEKRMLLVCGSGSTPGKKKAPRR